MIKREDLRIRDPFILTDKENGCYYMYTSTATSSTLSHLKLGVAVYRTVDLENFEEPVLVLNIADLPDFWADRDVWAPEVHEYLGNYYLFVSLKSADRHRGTQIFRAESPLGPFLPISELPVTPADWECLDGTLCVEDGRPYMVFCHEWAQIYDGRMAAVELTPDLSAPVGDPFVLFSASENPHSTLLTLKDGRSGYITDGPFLYREGGRLKMVWSSFNDGRYVVLGAESDGGIRGNWTQLPPIFDFDGGHSMIFNTLEGKRMISLHAPNYGRLERATFIEF
jgi:hypothetical protein